MLVAVKHARLLRIERDTLRLLVRIAGGDVATQQYSSFDDGPQSQCYLGLSREMMHLRTGLMKVNGMHNVTEGLRILPKNTMHGRYVS